MNIKVYTSFTKRRNSTKVPSSGGTRKTVTLKEGTSIENPTFLLAGDLFTVDYVEAFGHYYFVDDVVSVRNGLTEIKCSMDPLATHKTAIGNYTALIERSDYHYDISYPDPAVSIMNEMHCDDTAGDPGLYDDDGYFIVSVLNNVGSGTGFTCNYVISPANLQLLAQYVNTDWGSMATDLLGWFQATFLKTASSIIDCIWMPLKSSALSDLSITWENIVVGVDTVVVSGSPVTAGRMTGTCVINNTTTITIPHHYTTEGDFRRSAPYTIGKIFIPG